ncbi:hypothetical protein [Methylobacterium sp. SyP6R]|uniref:hypothetical protein n=1 Tax=Methylobacterium sp. SyP6R TaxID=2718876 RepID=UPI001F17FB50|nr:hypothetical protein [Methylobacterium sp. SyP6R]MCF4123880.1 hypothetical protein [Methylobacterium sp. SyP6R]
MIRNQALISGTLDMRRDRPLLDKALNGSAFGVDPVSCVAAARILVGIRAAHQNFELRRDYQTEILFRLSLGAICHQINWDFISKHLGLAFDEEGISAAYLANVTARDISRWFGTYHRPERLRAQERASLLRDLGTSLLRIWNGDIAKMLDDTEFNIQGSRGFLAQLDKFEAFREDPLRKKSNVIVHDLVRDKLVPFKDENSISPAIDYHIMRMYLRNGRVYPLHHETMLLLKGDSTPRPRLVKLLRQAVSEALSLTAFYAGMSIPQVNGLEWEIGREKCDRISPQCQIVGQLDEGQFINKSICIYSEFCRAYSDPNFLSLREPDLKKSFY